MKATFVLVLAGLCWATAARAYHLEPDEGDRPDPDPKQAKVDALFQKTYPGRPGCSISVRHQDKLVYQTGYGSSLLKWSDGSGKRLPMTEKTRIRLASTTKPLVATGILILRDQRLKAGHGDLLNETLGTIYPKTFPANLKDVTVRQLLSHTSGIQGNLPEPAKQESDAYVPYHVAADVTPKTAPGKAYSYSNTNYQLLADILTRRSGKHWTSYMREKIFDPLDMSQTSIEPASKAKNLAETYSKRKDGAWDVVSYDLWADSYLGSGGIISTAEDLGKLAAAMDAGKLLSPATWNLAFTAVPPTNDMGLGWGVSPSSIPDPPVAGQRYIQYHNGFSYGSSTVFYRSQRESPACRFSAAVLCNDSGALFDPYDLARDIERIYCGS